MTNKNKRGRPPIYLPSTRVRVSARGRYKLQRASDRRRVIEVLIELGGVGTIAEINTAMGWDATMRVASLIRSGWLEVVA